MRPWILLTITAAASWSQQADRAEIEIGPETTVLTEPLHPRGGVDYVRAMNEKYSRGVKPGQNAAAAIRLLVGDRELAADRREEYYRRLGVSPVDATARIVMRSDFDQDNIHQLEVATKRPWTEKELPVAAEWIQSNRRALALIREAARRPSYYTPYLSSEGRVATILLPDAQNSRICVRLLAAEAMLAIGQGDESVALDNLLTIRRLARLCAAGPFAIEALVACANDSIGFQVEEAYLDRVKPGLAKARFWRRKLSALKPRRELVEYFDTSERYMMLDVICGAARREPLNAVLFAENAIPAGLTAELVQTRLLGRIDFNRLLRSTNARFDALTAVLRMKDVRKRREAIETVEKEIGQGKERVARLRPADLKELSNAQLTGLAGDFLFGALTPNLKAFNRVQQKHETQQRLLAIGWATSAYRAEHNEWPSALKALVPKYLDQLPPDPCSGEAFRVRTKKNGAYVVYGVGPKGIDDKTNSETDITLTLTSN